MRQPVYLVQRVYMDTVERFYDGLTIIYLNGENRGDEWLKKLLGLDEGVFVNTPMVLRTLYGVRRPIGAGVRFGEAVGFSPQ